MPRFQKALAQLMGQGEGEERREEDVERPQRSELQRDGSGTVVSELRARVSTTELELVAPFARELLQNSRLLEGMLPPANLAALTLGACRFLCERHTLPLALRVYVPAVAEHGWSATHPVMEIAIDDQPGLVTSVCGFIEAQGARIETILSATVQVERDETGLAGAIRPGTGQSDECLLHLHLTGVANPADLESSMRRHLEALGRSRRESGPLLDEVRRSIESLNAGSDANRETAELLTWLLDDRMKVAGFEELDGNTGVARRSSGVFAAPTPGIEPTARVRSPGALLSKTRCPDPLHPGQVLDELRFATATPPETVVRIAGSLAAKALREPTSAVPVARTTYETVLAEIGEIDGERCRRIFDELPLDTVLGAEPSDVAALVQSIAAADEQPGIRVQLTPVGAATCLVTVIVPRQHLARSDTDGVSTLIRDRLAPILGRHVVSDELSVVRLHYCVDQATDQIRPELVDELVAHLHRTLASWRDQPMAARDARAAADTAATAAPPSQSAPTGAAAATGAAPPTDLEIHPEGAAGNRFRLRVPAAPAAGSLNELFAALDGLDLAVVAWSSAATPESGAHELVVETPADHPVDAAKIADTLRAVRAGLTTGDMLSSLGWRVGLEIAAIDVLRAFAALSESRGVGRAAVQRALVDNPDAARSFLDAFAIKFDPRLPVAHDAQRRRDLADARARYDAAVALGGDRAGRRILRGLGELLDQTVRTSFYRGDRHRPGRALALKLRSFVDAGEAGGLRVDTADRADAIGGGARQGGGATARAAAAAARGEIGPGGGAVFAETFVSAPSFEAVLLRDGPAARPFLRLADDLAALHATAALELADQRLRAAHVSTDPGSAVVALRRPPRSAAAGQSPEALYEFLRSHLDVIDNVVGGELERDPAIVAYDEADSYFSVVVGERPTGWAEVARRVVEERGFWMADAAVARYDERVAAEGAWAALRTVLVKSHRRRAQSERSADDSGAVGATGADGNGEPLTVVAIGAPDQLHLPEAVRLVAALDDHEIFVAPSVEAANCAKALDELRRRGGSSWSDFPVDLRGRGGAVIRRDARKVELSDEAVELLAWTDGGGEELARAVLAIDADLLWVRGDSVRAVSRAEMSGRPAEHLEVEVDRVGARGVAEVGAALLSPAARIELALAGRVVHTPASDSVAADLVADRVSNVELALCLAGAARETVEMHSDEVAAEIHQAASDLPRRQAIAIGIDERRSREDWPSAAVCIRRLRRRGGGSDPHLATDLDLQRRQGSSDGLTRPEIATLRSAVSLQLQGALRRSALCADPYLRPWIAEYLPSPITRLFPDLVDQHPLRDEIAALAAVERALEVMGFAFFANACETHGRADSDIVKAWCAAFIFGGAQEVWAEIEGAGLAAGSLEQQRHRLALSVALERATHRLVELRSVDLGLERMIDRFGGAVGELLRAWPEPLPESQRAGHDAAIAANMRAGLPRTAADHLGRIAHLGEIIDVCDLAIQINSPRSAVATAYFGLEPILRFSDIEAMVRSVRHQDPPWGARAEAHLRSRLSAARRGLTTDVVSSAAGRRRAIERWSEAHGDDLRRFQHLLGEVKSHGQASSAAVEVLIGVLENLARGQRRAR